jgi:hypothetical protein
MAIYTTFFVCSPDELIHMFPGWRPPLAVPVRRQFTNPFTGELTTVESREPDWPEDEEADGPELDYHVVSIDGDYADYLEGRLPPLVRACAHCAAKGLTEVELGPLAEALGVEPKFEYPLYAPPSWETTLLQELPPEMLPRLLSSDEKELQSVAERWAAKMSTPEHTHSVSGERLCDDWAASDAMDILRPIADLARRSLDSQRLYLLTEA